MPSNAELRDVRPDLPLALVMGGCGGMGLACVRRLAQRHRVMVADIDADRLAVVARDLRAEGHEILPLACDVLDPASLSGLVAAVAEQGGLTTLAYVLGLSPSMAGWRKIMDVNLVAAARLADLLLPHMWRGGAAVFISSAAGHSAPHEPAALPILDDPLNPDFHARFQGLFGPEPDGKTAYQRSKQGLMRMCRRLAAPWGARGVRIVSLSPGLIRTPMGDLEFDRQPAKYDSLRQIPLGRQGTLNEIADALDFLCSPRAAFITGTDLLVDGGTVAVRSMAPVTG